MNTMNITSAKYVNFTGQPSSISAMIDGQELFVPMTPGNRHYEALMAAVEAGTLVIQEADV
jgi:hypothetical protein